MATEYHLRSWALIWNKICNRKIIYKWKQRKRKCTSQESRNSIILASQSAFVEKFIFSARNQSRMSFVAEEETVTITGDCETGIWPKTSGWSVNLSWALETDNRLWVAFLQQQIGPLASVDFLIVDQTLGARELMWNSELAFNVACRAIRTVLVDSELIFTARCWDGSWIMFTLSAIDGPIVVAMIVDRSFAIEQQSVLACLQRQSSIGTEEEEMTILGMSIGLLAVLLWTAIRSSVRENSKGNDGNEWEEFHLVWLVIKLRFVVFGELTFLCLQRGENFINAFFQLNIVAKQKTTLQLLP